MDDDSHEENTIRERSSHKASKRKNDAADSEPVAKKRVAVVVRHARLVVRTRARCSSSCCVFVQMSFVVSRRGRALFLFWRFGV